MSDSKKELTEYAVEALQALGDCGPTVNVSERLVKGYIPTEDGTEKVYYSSDYLRRLSQGLSDAADYLRRLSQGLSDAADYLDARAGMFDPTE